MGNFYTFVTDCLGYKRNNELGWSDLTQEHKDLCRFIQFDKRLFKLILMPRFSLKSCLITAGYSLFEMVHNPNIRILIYSDSATKAEGFLSDIKSHILGKSNNSKFREYFPKLETTPQDGKWAENQIKIRSRTVDSKEPTVDTGGIETSKVGMHYDLIIFDDIVSDINTTTKAQMDKVYDCYKKSLSLLKPGGKVIVIGTRWHFGDAYGKMIADQREEFGIFIRKAEVNETYPFESIGLTKEFLNAQRERQGSFFYSCLYLNDPVDDTTALFRYEDFAFYEHVKTEGLYITCTCDPAGEGEDYTAITVVGTDSAMNMYLLYAKHGHLKPHQIIEEIVRLSYAFHFSVFGIETNFFNGFLEKELNLELEKHRSNPKFTPFSTEVFRATSRAGLSKNARVKSIQPYHQRRGLRFQGTNVESLRGSYSELAFQMLQYTETHKPVHDDLLDSLSYHISLIRKGDAVADETPPEGTFLSILNESRMQMNRLQKRLPLKHRRYLEPISF